MIVFCKYLVIIMAREKTMKKIGIILAMEKEFAFFAARLPDLRQTILHKCKFMSGNYNSYAVTAVICGMGKVNAALAASDLINSFNVDMIINIGISGGIDTSLNIGDFVIGKDIVYHDVWCGEPNKIGQVQNLPEIYHSADELIACLPNIRKGLICCGDQFISKQDDLLQIKRNFPEALAVDMESAAIAQICWLYEVPLLVVRQISDITGSDHQSEQYLTFWDNAPQHSIEVLQRILDSL